MDWICGFCSGQFWINYDNYDGVCNKESNSIFDVCRQFEALRLSPPLLLTSGQTDKKAQMFPFWHQREVKTTEVCAYPWETHPGPIPNHHKTLSLINHVPSTKLVC